VRRWLIARGANAAFVAAMEALLAVYARPVDPRCPLVCFDESGKELRAHAHPPQPARPGQDAREDPEYVRDGSVNLFLAYAPYLGWRQLTVTERRTAIDFAHAVRNLVDDHFPEADRITLVLDNLNTHTPAALYKAFRPAEAWRLLEKLEWVYTPTHGSWLNMAELEWSVLQRQCLARRIPTPEELQHEVDAWAEERNAARITASWHFTQEEARERLHWLYPCPQSDNITVSEHSG
jgi:transposase